MSILFIPDYSDGNPYQSNLADALDVDVTYGRTESSIPAIRALVEEDVSVVHVHWLNLFFKGDSRLETAVQFGILIARVLAFRLAGVPVVWTVHNVTMHEAEHPWLERRFKRWFITSGTCDRLVLHCEAAGDALVEELDLPRSTRDRMDVIPHGHYLDDYENDLTRREARESLGIRPSETVFLFFGMIRRYKGVFDLVEAFQSASIPDSRLVIAGKPATDRLHADLARRTSADDRIVGVYEFVPDDEVQRYMNAADAVVLPFRDITTSGSAVLAMSFGNALVVPTLGCLPELLDDDGAVLYNPDDPDGLRESLERVVERDTAGMGEANERTVQQYDWTSIADRTTATYRKSLGGTTTENADGGSPGRKREVVTGTGPLE